MMARPRMPIATAGASEYWARMMPQKNTAAIDSRIVAVRRFAVRRGAVFGSGRIGSAADSLLHDRRSFERVVRRRRRQRPLERVGAVPWPRWRRCPAADRLQNRDQQQQLRETEAERTD